MRRPLSVTRLQMRTQTVVGLPGHSFPWDLETSEQYPEQSISPEIQRVDRLPVTTEQAVTRPRVLRNRVTRLVFMHHSQPRFRQSAILSLFALSWSNGSKGQGHGPSGPISAIGTLSGRASPAQKVRKLPGANTPNSSVADEKQCSTISIVLIEAHLADAILVG